jgi:hypothetical protein
VLQQPHRVEELADLLSAEHDGKSLWLAVDAAFGIDFDYGQIIKSCEGESGPDAARRYSPGCPNRHPRYRRRFRSDLSSP